MDSIKFVAAEYSSKTGPYWKKLADDFKKKTGLTVQVQTFSWNDIHQQVTTMVQTGSPPDVVNLDTYAAFAAEGLLRPISEVESPGMRDSIPANLAAAGEYDGTPVAVPLLASTSSLFYNKTLFERAGIAQPPTTLDEVQQAAEAVHALSPETIGMAISLGPEAPRGSAKSSCQAQGEQWEGGLAGVLS